MAAQLLLFLAFAVLTHAQIVVPGVGYPHDWPGKPHGDYSPAWQKYFEVTKPLPNVTWPLSRNWAGNIGVDRPGHPNDTLFFWAFEKEHGSLTAPESQHNAKPWGIWLNGGPGSSSLWGMLTENGPIHVASDYSLFANKYGWNELADFVWLDQPVGTGFSTVDIEGWIADEDQMAEDFFRFLANLVKVFPSLRTRPLYLVGESYAGTFIPYIAKAYFGMKNPPVQLAKTAIGNGVMGDSWETGDVPVLTILETYPQLIGYDTEVFAYFKEQANLCGIDLNLTYPQHGHFPTLNPQPGTWSWDATQLESREVLFKKTLKVYDALARLPAHKRDLVFHREQLDKRDQWKRDVIGLPNGTIFFFFFFFFFFLFLLFCIPRTTRVHVRSHHESGGLVATRMTSKLLYTHQARDRASSRHSESVSESSPSNAASASSR